MLSTCNLSPEAVAGFSEEQVQLLPLDAFAAMSAEQSQTWALQQME